MSQSLIQISHLYKSFGSNVLFDDISLSINKGECFALIGDNGAGKTTFLKLLSKEVLSDRGAIQRASHLSMGFLPQEVEISHPNLSVREYLNEGSLSHLEEKMASCLDNPQLLDTWAELHEQYEKLGGYEQVPLEKVLKGLKLDLSLLDFSMGDLSSGERVRVAIAKSLIANPDLLLLDEPTNHLDQEMIFWLKEMLLIRKGATVIVSHDRQFLNTTCNRLIEIKDGKLTSFSGNYDFYLKEKKRLLEDQMKDYLQQKENRLILKKEIKALTFSKQKARTPTDRNIMAYDKRGGSYQKSQQHKLNELKDKLKQIEDNLISHPKPKTIKGLRFFPNTLRTPVAIELDHISKAFDKKVLFSEFSQVIGRKDRIILKGPNGSGKTTLLQCIVGILPIDSGEIVKAQAVRIGYLDQEARVLPMEKTPLEYFENQFHLTEKDIRSELHKAGIKGEHLLKHSFSSLSVGERKRLMILSLILEKPNVLLLDEPTNHLDFSTLEALEKALLEFKGAILAVSHDATFIDKINSDTWTLSK